MQINVLEPIRLGDTTQWIRVRSADPSNPVLLLIQQGPALPMINEARRLQRLLRLEDVFTVVYWDQRGCGRSLRGSKDGTDISLERMVDDTVSLLEVLRDRFGRAIDIAGFSLGATLGALAAGQRPDLVASLVTVGMDIDGAAAEKGAYDFVLATARLRRKRRAIRQLEAIGPPPHLKQQQFSTRARWLMNFGGVTIGQTYGSFVRALVTSMLRSSDYSGTDFIRTVRGMGATQAALLPELRAINLYRSLPHLDVPIVMVQGRHDQVSPAEAAQRYADALEAPSKQLVWFEHSAHTAHLDEPDRFRDVLLGIRTEQLAST